VRHRKKQWKNREKTVIFLEVIFLCTTRSLTDLNVRVSFGAWKIPSVFSVQKFLAKGVRSRQLRTQHGVLSRGIWKTHMCKTAAAHVPGESLWNKNPWCLRVFFDALAGSQIERSEKCRIVQIETWLFVVNNMGRRAGC
jgi:hypothetical protein